MNPETLLKWSEPKRIATKRGPRLLRKAKPTDEFIALYKANSETFYQQGISVGPAWRGPGMEVTWWQEVPAEIIQAEEQQIEASRATDADIEIPKPDGLSYLGYQKAGIAFAARAFERGLDGILIGDEMGLGKTIQAIGIINNDPRIHRVLVICPATLKLNWQRELEKWLTRNLTVGIADSQCFPSTDVAIINYDIIGKWPKRMSFYWDRLVCDECHYLKNPKAQRTQEVLGRRDRNPDKCKSGIPAKRKVFMTGTPICNRPIELFPIISTLDRKEFGNFFGFAKRYCGAHNNGFGWDFKGATNLPELQSKLRSSIMVRRSKKDVLKELPPKRRQVIELPCNAAAAKLVHQQHDQMSQWEDQLEAMRVRVELAKVSDSQAEYQDAVQTLQKGMKAAFSDGARLAHDIAIAKVPFVIEHIKSIIEDGTKVILFAHHLDAIRAFQDAFGTACVKVTGEVSYQERQAAVDRFQNDPTCTVFIGGIKAAGVGLTLTASSHVVFAELDWVPGNMSQAEDRAHRIGQLNSVLVQHLVLEGSLDAHIAQTIISKQEVIDSALDRKHVEEPIALTRRRQSVTITHQEIEDESQQMTQERITAIHRGLKMLSGVCDGAQVIDGAGFNKFDTRIGKELAARSRLSPKQATLGLRLVNKYRRQLPEQLVTIAKIKES